MFLDLPAIALPVAIPINMPVEIPSPLKSHNSPAVAVSSKLPASGNPVATRLIARDPEVSRSGTGRHISHRPADVNSKLSRLGRHCSRAQSSDHHSRSKHPTPHVVHNSSVPAGINLQLRPGFLPFEACLFLPPRRRLCTDSTGIRTKGCAYYEKQTSATFLITGVGNSMLDRLFVGTGAISHWAMTEAEPANPEGVEIGNSPRFATVNSKAHQHRSVDKCRRAGTERGGN